MNSQNLPTELMSEKSDQTGCASVTLLLCRPVGFHTLSVGLKWGENGIVKGISFSSRLTQPLGLKNSPQAIKKNICKVSVYIFPLFRLAAKIGGDVKATNRSFVNICFEWTVYCMASEQSYTSVYPM